MSGIILLFMASSVFAEQVLEIGKFDAKVRTNNVITASIGSRAEANTYIASVTGQVKVKDFKSNVNTKNAITAAIGNRSEANSLIGALIGAKAN